MASMERQHSQIMERGHVCGQSLFFHGFSMERYDLVPTSRTLDIKKPLKMSVISIVPRGQK